MNLSSLAASAEEFWIPVESNPIYGNGGGRGFGLRPFICACKIVFPSLPYPHFALILV